MIIRSRQLIQCTFFILTVLLLVNNFFIPLDKVVLPIYLGLLLATNQWLINKNIFFPLTIFATYILFITFLNLGTNDPLIFYPLLFVAAAVLAAKNEYIDFRIIRSALFFNILCGFVFVITHYIAKTEFGSSNLSEKGLPFIYAPLGFSPTIQVYGSCCIMWLILTFELQKTSLKSFLLVTLCLLITLNRASLLFLILLLFYYKRKIFYALMTFIVGMVIAFYHELQMILFNSSTIDSRVQLRQGVQLSYWQSENIWVYLFGRANHQTSPEIAQQTFWGRAYIENGMDFILHSYGMFGAMFYIFLLTILITKLLQHKQYKYASFSLYYLTVEQFLTNEFLASTLFFFILIILKLSNHQTASALS